MTELTFFYLVAATAVGLVWLRFLAEAPPSDPIRLAKEIALGLAAGALWPLTLLWIGLVIWCSTNTEELP